MTIRKSTNSSVTSLLAATLYQGNPDGNHKLWNIVSTEREIYIYSVCRCCWNVPTYKWKVHIGKIEIISTMWCINYKLTDEKAGKYSCILKSVYLRISLGNKY
jgi:hypothetical protein